MGRAVTTITPLQSPSLDVLAADPMQATLLSPETARMFLATIAGLLPLLITASVRGDRSPEIASSSERWLSVDEAVQQFKVTARWLYRHKRQLPHSQPSRKVLLFPEEKLRRWFAARNGR